MFFQYSQGNHTTQGHKGIPEGHFEEEQGRQGFFGPVSHLIRPQPSTRWTSIDGPLRPHLLDPLKLPILVGTWQRLLYNQDVAIYMYHEKSERLRQAFRNADGDTLYFCHQGEGYFLTEYGALPFRQGSYILIPKAIAHGVICSGPEAQATFLVIESKSSYFREPDRGMVGRNGFYDPAAFKTPNLDLQNQLKAQTQSEVLKIFIKRSEVMTTFGYASCYFDTVGWKGDYYPVALHTDDMMPLMSHRVHLPPSAHTSFVAQGFVVCTFLPRPLETDKDALKVPFYHQNIDYDEVLFYHAGNFFSRDNLRAGMMTFHPAGFPHGPHPKAMATIDQKTHTDEVAVMVDTQKALNIDPEFQKTELESYWQSWQKK